MWVMPIFFEELMVFFCVVEFLVERSKEVLRMCEVSGRPLVHEQDDECVSKEFPRVTCCGGALLAKMGGRASPKKKTVYDCTMGYPGEDVATKLLALQKPLH